MGNNACCSDSRPSLAESQRVEIQNKPLPCPKAQVPQFPALSSQVQSVLALKRPFERELAALTKPNLESFGDETYYGQLDANGRPSGWGKLFRKDGAVYVGQFRQGKAQGQGTCIFSDGSYYEGEMMNNLAETTSGYFFSHSLEYRGGFHLNRFHGQGVEKGPNFEFSGEFQHGKRKIGILKWEDGGKHFFYTGSFDIEGKFTGKGKLNDPFGTYEGQFRQGVKEGFGSYQFKTGIRYEGYYKGNAKHGRGSIINADGTIAFCGEFLNGLPHGKGYATDKKGVKHSLQWNEGVYADLI